MCIEENKSEKSRHSLEAVNTTRVLTVRRTRYTDNDIMATFQKMT